MGNVHSCPAWKLPFSTLFFKYLLEIKIDGLMRILIVGVGHELLSNKAYYISRVYENHSNENGNRYTNEFKSNSSSSL